MNRFLLTAVSAIAMCMASSSCTKDVILESTQTDVSEVVISNEHWAYFPGSTTESSYLYAKVTWPSITQHVIDYGNLDLYIKVNNKYFPLPYISPITYNFSDGTSVTVAQDVSYYVKTNTPGEIYIIIRDMDGYEPYEGGAYIDDITLKLVATWPVNYIIEQ